LKRTLHSPSDYITTALIWPNLSLLQMIFLISYPSGYTCHFDLLCGALPYNNLTLRFLSLSIFGATMWIKCS
jgi:hypothetical protein